MTFLEAIKKNGMRKMAWALVALVVLAILTAMGSLGNDKTATGTVFQYCFIALCGFVLGANYGEHKEKAKAEAAASALETPK